MKREFAIVDVFAEQKYSGNQLAVVSGAETLSDSEMQAIAREMNYSETTFIYSDTLEPDTWRVRIFTVEEELPFAGHPSIGSAWVIRNLHRTSEHGGRVILRLKAGDVPVDFTDTRGVIWMTQGTPDFGRIVDNASAASLLNLQAKLIDPRFPCQVVSTGLPFLLIPLLDLASVQAAELNREIERSLLPKVGAKFAYPFSRETYDGSHHANARMFAESTGMPEDPATGSAAGCLAAYTARYSYLKELPEYCLEQGYEIGRPSLIYLRSSAVGEHINVEVGGRVILTASGHLD